MNITDKIRFKKTGKVFTVDEFASIYTEDDLSDAMRTIDVLLERGDVVIAENKSKEQKIFEKAAKDENIREKAQAFDEEEELLKDNRASMKREGRATYPKIKVDYPTMIEATKAQRFYEAELRLHNIEMSVISGQVSLIFRDITDAELNFINRTYKADKFVASTVNVVSSGAERVTKSIDYTAKNVAAPILDIGAKSVVSIFKSAASVLTKTGATLVNAGAKGVKDTYRDISEDPDVIKARRELIETTSSIKRSVANKTGATSSGITIMD